MPENYKLERKWKKWFSQVRVVFMKKAKKIEFTYFALAVSSPSLSCDAFNPRIYSLNAEK